MSREQVREALQERSISGLNIAEDGRTDGALDTVGRLSRWCLPLGSANMLGQKRVRVHLAHSLCVFVLSISRARTSRVNEGIAQKGTAEILQHFLKHLILHFRKMPSDCCVWKLDADLLVFCLIAKFSCHKDFRVISTPPTLSCSAFATVLSYITDFFS